MTNKNPDEQVRELRSVIKPEFRAKYKELGGFADELGQQISAFLKGADGKPHHARLAALASANDIDLARYSHLNPGQVRMNVGNRLRALSRKGATLVWPDQEPKKRRDRPRKSA